MVGARQEEWRAASTTGAGALSGGIVPLMESDAVKGAKCLILF